MGKILIILAIIGLLVLTSAGSHLSSCLEVGIALFIFLVVATDLLGCAPRKDPNAMDATASEDTFEGEKTKSRRTKARFVSLFVLSAIWYKGFAYLSRVSGDGAGHATMPPNDFVAAVAPFALVLTAYLIWTFEFKDK